VREWLAYSFRYFSDKFQAVKFVSRVRNEPGAEATIQVPSGMRMWLATGHNDMRQRLGPST
jgi:hypothetical protein